uniref:MerC family mercury resistance protein n=1 Tax=Fulvivirga sp. TaxID=1931237 RepID=UPI00404B0786
AGLQFLANPLIEISLIILSAFVASFALYRGFSRFHKDPLPLVIVGYGLLFIVLGRYAAEGWQEVLYSCVGAISIAASHLVNWMRMKQHLSNMI